jgi:hypothetical protein
MRARIPSGEQVLFMRRSPCHNSVSHPVRSISLNDSQWSKTDDQFPILVKGVNSRAKQFHTQHPNHDSIKLGDDRHILFPQFDFSGQVGHLCDDFAIGAT